MFVCENCNGSTASPACPSYGTGIFVLFIIIMIYLQQLATQRVQATLDHHLEVLVRPAAHMLS